MRWGRGEQKWGKVDGVCREQEKEMRGTGTFEGPLFVAFLFVERKVGTSNPAMELFSRPYRWVGAAAESTSTYVYIPRNCYLPQASPPPLRRDLSKMIYARLLLTRPHFTFSFPLFFCHLLPGDFLLLLLPPSHPLSFFCSSQGRLPACHAFFRLLNRGRRKRRGKGLMLFSPQLIPFSCLTCLFLLCTREDEKVF